MHSGSEEAEVCCTVAVTWVSDTSEIPGEDLFLEGIHCVGNALKIVECGHVSSNFCAEAGLCFSMSVPRIRKLLTVPV